jgi:hypothetical protein
MAKRVWVGMNGDWIATIDEQALVLANIYTWQLIELRPWEGYFFQCCYYHDAEVDSSCEDIDMNLLKIMICKVPTKSWTFRGLQAHRLVRQGSRLSEWPQSMDISPQSQGTIFS